MATTVTRSNAEILRLLKVQWGSLLRQGTASPEVDAILVNTSGAGTPPTAASSTATWLTYAIMDINDPEAVEGYPYLTINSSAWTYDATDGRAESGTLTFNFDAFIAADFSQFTSTTVTHIVICDAYGLQLPTTNPPLFVLAESPSLTLTGSSTLSRSLQLFGKEA